jgi:NADH:ubiquinone oxidoreductase subunit E
MPTTLIKIAPNDPVAVAEKRSIIDDILEENQDRPGATMVILNELQSRIGFISPAMQEYVANKLHEPVSKIHGVITFYSFFTTQPRGKHTIKFCLGTACYVGGSPQLLEKARQALHIEPGQTTEDGNITIEICRCVGACSQAPVIVVDEVVQGRMKPSKIPQIIRGMQDEKVTA